MDSNKLHGYLEALEHRDEITQHLVAGIRGDIEKLTRIGLTQAEIAEQVGLTAAKPARKPRVRSKAKATSNAQ